MASIATVFAITGNGKVYAVNANGVQRELKEGDKVEKGETIRTVGDVNVDVIADDTTPLHINPDQVVKLDENLFHSDLPTAADAALATPATAATVIDALAAGTDLSTTLDATAAGGGDGGGGGGATFVQLGRISEGVNGNSYGFDFSGLGINGINEGIGAAPTATVTVAGVTATVTVNPIAGDGVISAAEDGPTTVVSGTVGGDAKAGDTVTITVNGNTYNATVVAGSGGAFTYSTEVNTADLKADSTATVSYTVTNADGTATSTATAEAVVAFDLVAAGTIKIDAIGDDVITPAEIANGAVTTVTGTVGGDAKVGDVVTVLVNGHSYDGTVSQGQGGLVFSVPNVLVSDMATDKTIEAKVTVTDPYGNTFTASDIHSVTGASTISNDGQEVKEDTNVSDGGTLNTSGAVVLTATTSDGTAVLNPSTLQQTSSGTALGTLNVNADGTYNFSVANSAVQNLAQGESVVQTYEVKSADGTATSQITITINGTNDAPLITSAAQTGGVTEDTGLTATGQVTSSDVDNGANATYTFTGSSTSVGGTTNDGPGLSEFGSGGSFNSASYGTFSIDASTGAWKYTLNNGTDGQYSPVQALAAGQTHTETYTVTVTDDHGATATQDVVITITGTNDAPVIYSIGPATGLVTEDALPNTTTGYMYASDVDSGGYRNQTWGVSGESTSSYGSFSVSATSGQWTYELKNENSAVQALAVGESVTDTFAVQVDDGQGGITTKDVVITILGTNDAPVITSDAQTGSVTEDTSPTAVGTVTSSDVDHAATAAYSTTGQIVGGGQQFTVSANTIYSDYSGGQYGQGQYGTFSVDASTGQWKYELNNTDPTYKRPIYNLPDEAVIGDTSTQGINLLNAQRLGAGESAVETYTVVVTDDHGETATQNVVITINGTNDNPVIHTYQSVYDEATQTYKELPPTGNVTEDTSVSTSGSLYASDIDRNEQGSFVDGSYKPPFTWSVVGAPVGDFSDGHSLSGSYGTFSVSTYGQWTFQLDQDPSNTLVQQLAEGTSITQTFTVQVADGHGGTDTQDVVITINGTNDAPVITSDVQKGSVTEGSDTPATGTVTSSDVDLNHTATYTAAAIPQALGTFTIDASTGVWKYEVDNSNEAVTSLHAGQTLSETYTVTVSDGLGGSAKQEVLITINGTDQAPVISGTVTGEVQEDVKPLYVDGTLSAGLPNGGSAHWTLDSSTGTYGNLSLSGGTWTYQLNNKSDVVQNLAEGESHKETFTVKLDDGLGNSATQTITVLVTGTNDAPTISLANEGSANGAVTEDGTLKTSGQLNSDDIDNGATATWTINGSSTGTYGSFAVDTTGKWEYTLNNDANVVQALPGGTLATETFSVVVTDDKGATAVQTISVNITGTNDVPVISGDKTGAVYEDTDVVNTPHTSTVPGTGGFWMTSPNMTGGVWVEMPGMGGSTTTTYTHDLKASGSLSIADKDTGESWLRTQAPISGNHSYGTFTLSSDGAWTYTASNDQAAIQRLGVNETLTDSFTATSKDGSATEVVTVTIHGTNDVPTMTMTTGGSFDSDSTSGVYRASSSVYESGLSAGSQIPTPHPTTLTGTFTVNDPDARDTLYVTKTNGTHGDVTLTQGSGGQWTWSYTLKSAIDNASNSSYGTDSFTLTVDDHKGGVKNQTVSINIVDDIPVASNINVTGETVVNSNTNLLLVLDVSGSMKGTGLLALQNASLALMDQYDAMGDVKVRIESFSSGASELGSGWMSVAEARGIINGLVANGSTNYDAALIKAIHAWNDTAAVGTVGTNGYVAATAKLDHAQNVGYFVSDGQPNGGQAWSGVSYSSTPAAQGIQAPEQAVWEQFLRDNHINMFALGMGSSFRVTESTTDVDSMTNLNSVAYNGVGAGSDGVALAAASTNVLGSVVVKTLVASEINGHLTDGSGGTFGADGAGHVGSVQVDGKTYTWTGSVAEQTGSSGVFHTNDHTWEITTGSGGTLTVYMDDGAYKYTPPSTIVSGTGVHETVTFSLVDHDGDSSQSSGVLDIKLDGQAVATIGDAGVNSGGSFDASSSGVHNIMMGMDGDDVIKGGSASDLISGGHGNDTLTGNGGNDVFRWGVGDNANLNASTPETVAGKASDKITDFHADKTPGTENDVLDLRDLLVGEHSGNSYNLDKYLQFSEVTTGSGASAVTSVVISVDHDGSTGLSTGANAFAADQKITLNGVSLATLQGAVGVDATHDLIHQLIKNGNLKTDV